MSIQEFLEKNLPNYYGDDRIALIDDLYKYIHGDGEDEFLARMKEDFPTREDALEELIRLGEAVLCDAVN